MLFFFYLQKRAVQVITNSWASSAPLFTELGMLDIIQANLIQYLYLYFIITNNYQCSRCFSIFLTKVKYMVIQLKQPVAIDQTIVA